MKHVPKKDPELYTRLAHDAEGGTEKGGGEEKNLRFLKYTLYVVV